MPTRQVLLGLALLGAAGTGWADDAMFNRAEGPADAGSRAPAGMAFPPLGTPPAYRDSDTIAGVNVGQLYRLGKNTWLGLASSSSYEQDLDERSGVASPVANLALGFLESNRLIADTRAPRTITASVAHRLDSGWMLSASLGWQGQGWGGLDRSANEAQAFGAATPGASEHRYRDTWRLALGAEQQLSERLSWSVGVRYGSSLRAGKGRTPTDPLPENLRLAAGLRYQMEEGMELQFGYSLVRFGASPDRSNYRGRTDNILPSEPGNSTLRIIGGGMVWRF
ncbi:outer membrane protein transport protein [Azotobacter beijerinckii]|uniref:outer membrane protein transport protein n=1 Tax=Azotobacter beijerinckii TaxID=170623 RepID=UPI002955BBFE|nr:outer membrane protein transport protein [Azotobacter beijerinckii]MDV7211864.1 outer membrane protein transport protein [Azotobacter beijerinckii]